MRATHRSTGDDRRDAIDQYLEIFFTQKFDLRGSFLTSSLAKKHSDLVRRLEDEKGRVGELLHRRRAVETRERTFALVTIAAEVIERYRAEKDRRGLLDYDDLIDKTLHLLASTAAAWVHYKLDLGVDHVLIDEAQDTSPKQWEIVKRLTAEFAAGKGAREITRSVFAVGDEKQSIFSFQGAEPAQFEETKRHYAAAFRRAELDFADVKFRYSFRSAPVVLDAVDTVFRRAEAHAGLTEVPGAPVHEAVRANAPGLVESGRWSSPTTGPRSKRGTSRSTRLQQISPRVRLANRIARSIKAWIARREPVGEGDQRHAVRPGDILVLVRQRGTLFDAIIYALKKDEYRGRGRRPADAHRAHRRDGPHGARRCAAAARRRSRACERAEEPAVRIVRGAALHARLGPQGLAARGSARAGGRSGVCRRERAARPLRRLGAARCAVLLFTRVSSAPSAGGQGSSRGSGRRPPTRSTNSSNTR